jgi:hypothetical protein
LFVQKKLNKMNIKYLIVFCLVLFTINLSAQQVVIDYQDDGSSEDQKLFRESLIGKLKGKERVALYETSSNKAATHLLNTELTVQRYTKADDPIFVDSSQIIRIKLTYGVSAFSYADLKNIATSEIVLIKRVGLSLPYQEEKVYKYSDFKVKKGTVKKLKPAARKKLFSEIKSKASNGLLKKVNVKFKERIKKAAEENITAVRGSFSYQLKVKPNENGKSKTVVIEGGKNYDLEEYTRMVFYTKEAVKNGDKTIYRLRPICHGFIKSVDGNNSIGKLNFGKKKMKKAMEEGLDIYANQGKIPLQLDEEKVFNKGLINIAVADVQVPAAAKKFTTDLVQKLEYSISLRKDFNLLTRKTMGDIQQARVVQKGENMMDKVTIDQYKMAGADVLVAAEVSEMLKKGDNAIKGYYIIKLYDVETGNLMATKKYNVERNNVTISKMETAKVNIFKYLNLSAKPLMDELMPPLVQIIDIDKEKKGKAKTVIIAGDIPDSAYGNYIVYLEKKYVVDGEAIARLVEVGEVSLRQSEGEGVYLGKVKSGGKEIFTHMGKNEQLVCRKKDGFLNRTETFGKNLSRKLGGNIKD